jgi:hypothetical protein
VRLLRTKGKMFPVPVSLSTTPSRLMWEWRFGTTVIDPGTRWRWVVSFTPQLLYLLAKSPRCPLDRRLHGHHMQHDRRGAQKTLLPHRQSNPGCPTGSPSLYWLSCSDTRVRWIRYRYLNWALLRQDRMKWQAFMNGVRNVSMSWKRAHDEMSSCQPY